MCPVSCMCSHLVEKRALPRIWGFDHGHGARLLACVTGLFMAQTALPASTFEMLFHIGLALFHVKSESNNLGSPGPCSSLQLGHLLLVAVSGAQSCSKQSQQ